MKTNQNLIRNELYIQRTKDGYFHANTLLDGYNKATGEKRQMGNYTKTGSYKKFVDQLILEGISNPSIAQRGGNHKGTWLHPKLFIDFAMWVSVEFKSKVIDYVIDGLIKSRNDAGDYYNEMVAMIMKKYIETYNTKPNPMIYINEARMIKELAGIDKDRNELPEKDLDTITALQKLNAELIHNGVGKDSRRKQLETLAKALKR